VDDVASLKNLLCRNACGKIVFCFLKEDNTFLSRALVADMFIPYRSPHLSDIPDDLKLDPNYRLLPVDYGDVCLNYDKKWF
jgi:thiamine transport system substrate-binding protein